MKFSLRYWTKCHILIFFSQLCPAFKSWPPVSSFCGCWHLHCCRSRRGSNLTMVSSTSTTSYRTPWTFSCQCYYELKCDTQFWTSCLLSTTVSYFFGLILQLFLLLNDASHIKSQHSKATVVPNWESTKPILCSK